MNDLKTQLTLIPIALVAIAGVNLLVWLAKEYSIPKEIFIVPLITILMLYHVVTLPADTNKKTKIAKYLAAIGLMLLSASVILNVYIIEFFQFHYSMLAIAIVPAFLYSFLYERGNET